jgi:hypothetical protein
MIHSQMVTPILPPEHGSSISIIFGMLVIMVPKYSFSENESVYIAQKYE